jgi:hypothetical protein
MNLEREAVVFLADLHGSPYWNSVEQCRMGEPAVYQISKDLFGRVECAILLPRSDRLCPGVFAWMTEADHVE